MAQIIEIPGVGRVEFPDGMSEADIVGAIKRMPAQQKQPSVADEVGPLQAALIGAGRSTDKIINGVRQMYNAATGDQATLDKLAAEQQSNDQAYAPLKAARPWATGIGEAAPSLAVPIGGAGGAAAFIGKSALAGGLPGALSYGSLEDRARSGALGTAGGALGGALGLGIGKLLQPASKAGAISQEAAQAAENIGLKLTAGQKTQNPALINFENYLSRSPGSSGAMQARAAQNATAMNTSAAKAMGQSADNLGEGVFSTAKNAIGAEFNRLGSVTKPQIGDDFMAALANLEASNAARGSFRSKPIDSLIDKGLDLAATGKLTGTAYKEIRSELSSQAQTAFKGGDATYGQALKTVRNALDDAAKSSLSEADQKAWDVARSQWAAYKALSKSNVSEGGNVSAARLAATLRQGGDAFRTGAMKGPLADIGRVGEAVKGAQNPNSGQLVSQMLYGNPLTGVPMMAGNKAMQWAYMKQPVQSYLTNGLADLSPEALMLIQRGALPTGLPVVQCLLGAQ